MNNKVTVARFLGCVKETCSVGGSISLRGIYEIPHPEDGTVSLYERHTSQIRGMGWNPTTQKPTLGRVWAWIGFNGHYSAVGTHVMRYEGPETVEVTWESKAEVAYRDVAIALAGRAHIPNKQIRDREPANPYWRAAAEEARVNAPEGWSLEYDTGHGKSTPCPDLSVQIAQETERINKEFDELLNRELVSRAEWKDGERPTYYRLKDTDEGTIDATIQFNCGVTPDYNVPAGWQPSEESRKRLAEMRTDKARREAEAKANQERFVRGWEILRGRYQAALGALGLAIGEDNHSLQDEFRVGAKNADGVYAECPAGGKNGPHYHTSCREAADWLDANATTYDAASTASHLLEKIQKAVAAKTVAV